MADTEEDIIYQKIRDIRLHDRRFGRYAYQFALDLVDFAQEAFNRANAVGEGRHVSPEELLSKVETFAFHNFGLGSELVLQHCGMQTRGDLGQVMDHLVKAELLSRNPSDSWACFSGHQPLVNLKNHRFNFE